MRLLRLWPVCGLRVGADVPRHNCPVCRHDGRAAIDVALAADVPLREITRRFSGITDVALKAHAAGVHLPVRVGR